MTNIEEGRVIDRQRDREEGLHGQNGVLRSKSTLISPKLFTEP